MKMLAFLSAGNLAFLPVMCPALAVMTVLAVAVAVMVWPVAELIGAVVE